MEGSHSQLRAALAGVGQALGLGRVEQALETKELGAKRNRELLNETLRASVISHDRVRDRHLRLAQCFSLARRTQVQLLRSFDNELRSFVEGAKLVDIQLKYFSFIDAFGVIHFDHLQENVEVRVCFEFFMVTHEKFEACRLNLDEFRNF